MVVVMLLENKFVLDSFPSWGAMCLGVEMVRVVSGERSPHMLIGNLNLSFLPAPVEAKHKKACAPPPRQIQGCHTLVLTPGFLRTTFFHCLGKQLVQSSVGPVSVRRELFLNLCKHPGMVTPLPEGTLLLAAVISTCYQLGSCEVGGWRQPY